MFDDVRSYYPFFFSLYFSHYLHVFSFWNHRTGDDGDDDDGDGHLKSMEKPMLKVNSGFNKGKCEQNWNRSYWSVMDR